jgi:alpha-amylase/alpha-mannosidase (GH57 family)
MSTRPPRYICIHGHFYQPPRENPWLEAVEVQDSASPYHDWNDRITRECYAPNTRSRFVDSSGRIINLLNNYASMSFNFGPTLFSWMEEAAPEVLQGIVEGDRLSRERRRGHGNALAQVYNHVIMPLASERDKRTQVAWGIADFRRRFGREPEGMWLPETAADLSSLEALAAAGIRFTILSPSQAKRWRKIGENTWPAIEGDIDPSRGYLCRLPSGRSIHLFFYDGNVSRQVAFERLLDRGETFLERLLQGFDDRRTHAQLMHIASDGESYGHHHAHGDMALAYVHYKIGAHPEIKLTNYGEFLELHPPEWEVEIHENSSWSCAHGIERWRANCGCNMGRGWQQEWRAPLRQALEKLKQRLDHLFATRGRECFPDPWAARDGYIDVILDRSPSVLDRFLQQHAHPDLDETLRRDAIWFLEMQRHAQLMFTSCGWFFDEISGLETTQCLRYAARALQLARHFHVDFEDEFVAGLAAAPSNLARFKNGKGVWEQLVRPEKIDLQRVLAHYAISTIYRQQDVPPRQYCYEVQCRDEEVRGRGNTHLAMGRLHVRSRLTSSEGEASFVVLHYGGLDFHCVLRQYESQEEYQALRKKLFDTYQLGSFAEVTQLVLHEFKAEAHKLDDLFLDEQRRIIGIVLKDRFADYQRLFERLADEDEDVLAILGRLRYPIPKALLAAASVCLDGRLQEEIARLETDGDVSRIRLLLERGRAWGYQPEREMLRSRLGEQMQRLVDAIAASPDLPQVAERVSRLLDVAGPLDVHLDLWQAQNRLINAYGQLSSAGGLTPALREMLERLAGRLNMNPELLGWKP